MFDIEKKLKIEVITVYEVYDADEEESDEDLTDGEYSGITVKIDGEEFLSFGDEYHDKGYDKANAVIEALEKLFGESKIDVEYIDQVNRL